jgi:hypothetical protein
MADTAPSQVYHYSAHALGLSAKFERPIEHLIEVQAPSSLASTGGHSYSRVNNFRFEEFVSFSSAYSYVSGSQKSEDGTYTTLSTATVEGLNILDVVTADRLVARLASQHSAGKDEASVVVLGSTFDNLRIAGCRAEVQLHHELFLSLDTNDAIRKALASNSEFRTMAEDPYQTGQKRAVPNARGVLLCSLVKDIRLSCPGVKSQGHTLVVPQFGKIFLAEMLVQPGMRTLTMLRFDLGSPGCGTGVVSEAAIDGDPW